MNIEDNNRYDYEDNRKIAAKTSTVKESAGAAEVELKINGVKHKLQDKIEPNIRSGSKQRASSVSSAKKKMYMSF